MPGAVLTVLPAGLELGLVLGIVLVVPAPTAPVTAPVVTPPLAPGVVAVVVLGVVMVAGHGVVPRVDVLVLLVVPVVPAVGFVPIVLPVPPTVEADTIVEPDPAPMVVEGVGQGVINRGAGIDGEVEEVPMPICDWAPTDCAANPIEKVRIDNVSHCVRILNS
ncbi:MAG: hypothetical protein JWO13_3190 [Acidobacteriales bacterium]|nr:hypothetical protein [Terriglobales bacterium]